MKICSKCFVLKNESEYCKCKNTKDGLQYWCTACQSARDRKLYNKEWVKNNRERVNAAAREHNKKPNYKFMKLSYKLKTKYGITIEDYNLLLNKQDNRCRVCYTDNPGHNKRFYVDHNHKTGKIRGLLCSNCNTGLGLFKDNAHFLQRAIEYLQLRD